MIGALELGIIYGVMALGVYLTFKVLNFPDLTVDGSFTTGAATAAALILSGTNPVLATLIAAGAGVLAGVITGLLHTKGGIDGLLAGILTMIALWSVNLRIMGKANLPLLRETTIMTPLKDERVMGTWMSVAAFLLAVLVLKFIVDWFLTTNLGLAIQATGNNKEMIRSLGVNTDNTTILTLALSNGLVAACGAIIGQYQGFADISMGVGLILVGLASVILGQALLGSRTIAIASLAVIVGSIIYRLIIFYALRYGLNPNDMKAVTAILVVAALLLPRWGVLKRIPALRGRGNRAPGQLAAEAQPAPAAPAAAPSTAPSSATATTASGAGSGAHPATASGAGERN